MLRSGFYYRHLEDLPWPACIYDENGVITACSQRAKDLLGDAAHELRLPGRQQGETSGFITVTLPNGDMLRVLQQLSPLFDDEDKPDGVLCCLTDVTRLVPAAGVYIDQGIIHAEELKKKDDRYHKMVEEVEDYAILMMDDKGIIQNWNKGAEKIKGYTEDEIIGQHFQVFYLPEDRQAGLPEQLMHQAIVHGKATHEGWRMRKDRSVFWGSIVITALHNEDNEIIGFTKVTRDLTERKKAENKLRQYAAELEYQNNELKQFNYIASHDLQEPLRKITTFGEMLIRRLDGRLDAETTDLIKRMQSAATRMKHLIDDLLSYSRISMQTDFQLNLINAALVVEEVTNDLDVSIREKNGLIKLGRLFPVRGNEWQLRQLFHNLLTNAIKYSKKEVPPVISITGELVKGSDADFNLPSTFNDHVFQLIKVSDNGIGFDPQYTDKIFQVFQRLHGRSEYEGSGIGLSIVQKIIKNHNGYVKAVSEPGNGAVFSLLFPYIDKQP